MSSVQEINARWARLPAAVEEEIQTYETELGRYLDGQVQEKVFLEFRLRHGAYGQRQPNTQMQRIKIPLGLVTADQLDVLAECAEEYSDAIAHVTTRQDFQLHFVDIKDTPNLFRRLAESGITTREACGNTVRNVTACPRSGSCTDELFDVTPHAHAMAYFLLRHPDAQNFGRKFKIAFSGCEDHPCGLARMHDIGAIAAVREVDGTQQQGFKVFVGGGLGAVPHQAKLYSEFLTPEEMLPFAQAVSRVFAKHGEKKNRARARMKFLVDKLGIEEFVKLVQEEISKLPADPARDECLAEAVRHAEAGGGETAPHPPSELDLAGEHSADFVRWHRANVRPQKQSGYSIVTVFLPLGDLTSEQLRALSAIARKYASSTLRTSVGQNFLLHWVSNGDLPAVHEALVAAELGLPMADTIADMTACPGTDSCKLGIASSRGLASVLHREFERLLGNGDVLCGEHGEPRQDITVKMSGCFNSCGQHHIANIGFFGSSKRKAGRVAPVFQVILGGTAVNNADSFGLPVAKIGAVHAPEAVRRLVKLYDKEKTDGENFKSCMDRLGKVRINEELADITEIGDDEAYFHDNRQPWEYVKQVEAGECAGEVVTGAEFLLDDAERFVFEATLKLDGNHVGEAAQLAFKAMQSSADALLSTEGLLLSDSYDKVSEFRERFWEKGRFFAGVGEYFFRAAEEDIDNLASERVRQLIEEANLFTEEAHVVYGRMAGAATK